MNFRFGENTTISRLRVPYSGDALQTRLRFTSLLGGMNLHPASLAPSAIVFIKRLQKRYSFENQLSSNMFSEEWQREIVSDLSSLIGRAARPAHEAVSYEAESLFFADEAELLACLTSDWLKGNANQKWWWRSLFTNGEIASIVTALWRKHSESAPAVLHLLSKRGEAVRFVEALDANDVHLIWQNIAEQFALPKLSFSSLIAFEENEIRKVAFNAEKNSDSTPKITLWQATKSDTTIIAAPWHSEIPRNVLSAEKECLLGIALMIFRAPSLARSKQFAEQTARWLKQKIQRETKIEAINTATSFLQDETDTKSELIEFSKTTKLPDEKKRVSKTKIKFDSLQTENKIELTQRILKERTLRKKRVKFDANISLPKEIESENQSTESTITLREKRLEGKEQTNQQLRKENMKPHNEQTVIQTTETSTPESEPSSMQIEARIYTEFGGVFYLINLALFLNLYNDFTNPKEEDLHLNIWDFVYLLGQTLTDGKDSQDEIWSLLASLAMREIDEPPAQNFLAPDEWRISSDWIEPFRSNDFWVWSDADNRLRLWHPVGFIVLDLPLKKNVKAQLQRETKAFKEFGYLPSRLKHKPRTITDFEDSTTRQISIWFDWLCSYMRARLSLALGCDEERAVGLLCRQRANVFVTPTHIDVLFSLKDLPMEIRLSGLDRNPGWLPSAGKFIAFHYE